MAEDEGKILSVDCRPIRPIGGAIGCSIDLDALRDLGVVDDDGELVEEIDGRQTVREDGRIVIDLDLETVENAEAAPADD